MTNILSLLEHIISVVNYELKTADLFNIFFIGIIEFAVFYFFSKFAKNIFLKTLIFAFALKVLFDTVQDNSILTEPLIFATFGLIAPHFDIFSKLIQSIRNISLALYKRVQIVIGYISIPFKWIANFFTFLKHLFKKTSKNNNQNKSDYEEKSYKNYYNEKSSQNHKKEQQQSKQKNSYSYQQYQESQKQKKSSSNKQQNNHKQEKKEQQQKSHQKSYNQKQSQNNSSSSNSGKKSYSRWDSTNVYEVLGIRENANQKEIKKAFRNLAKIYHPDLTQDKKEQHKIIFQKINNAYKKLKK